MDLATAEVEPPLGEAMLGFDGVAVYAMFLGYPRSGHSLLGALLNAHPEAVIAHELDALAHVAQGVERTQLFSLLVARDRWFTAEGSTWFGYSYRVPSQWQGRCRRLRVIGDKKGGQSTVRLRDEPHLLARLRSIVQVPVRILHVVRNPFDNITTLSTRSGQSLEQSARDYFMLGKTVEKVIAAGPHGDFLTLRHEDFVAQPRVGLERVCRFLSLPAAEDYLHDCASIVFQSPARSREKLPWPPALIRTVEREMHALPHLAGYSFES